MKLKGVKIKPGMVIETKLFAKIDRTDFRTDFYIVFPLKYDKLAVINIYTGVLRTLKNFVERFDNDIVKIYDLQTYIPDSGIVTNKILWEKPENFVVTKQQIADMFNVSVDQISIE